jgi:dTDP-glucose 4,6-dehydratase
MYKKNILITGGCGFIGNHVVRLFANKYPDYKITVVDKLTYCGKLENIEDALALPNVSFVQYDICDYELILNLIRSRSIDSIIHLAAESHVDNSIKDPFTFAKTNVMGTLSLLHAAKTAWLETEELFEGKRFYHISTDEVYGALDLDGIPFTEETPYAPHSPYSASKASSDHFVRAYYDTYGLPTIISNCSNNYGPRQYPEKLIPLVIDRIKNNQDIPIYGNGENIRDWLYVEDHANAIDVIFHGADPGDTYNIGGNCEISNINMVRGLIFIADKLLGRPEGESLKLIKFVPDRLGHDFRYSIDSTKLLVELGWKPITKIEEGLEKTVQWYLDN